MFSAIENWKLKSIMNALFWSNWNDLFWLMSIKNVEIWDSCLARLSVDLSHAKIRKLLPCRGTDNKAEQLIQLPTRPFFRPVCWSLVLSCYPAIEQNLRKTSQRSREHSASGMLLEFKKLSTFFSITRKTVKKRISTFVICFARLTITVLCNLFCWTAESMILRKRVLSTAEKGLWGGQW